MTTDERRPQRTPVPGSVTGVARGNHGTGTALDDTQVYDVADFAPVAREAEAPQAAPESIVEQPLAQPVVHHPAPVGATVQPVAQPVVTGRRAAAERRPRVGAPVLGLVGFAVAAGLAILIGASLGGMTGSGSANGDATFEAPATEVPLATEALDEGDGGGDGESEGNGDGNNGSNGNNGNGNGNGRGNGNDDD